MAAFVGTSGSDTLNGGSGDDEFRFSSGQDTISGGDGYDIIRASGPQQDYTITSTENGIELSNGTDTTLLTGIEKIEFDQPKEVFNLTFDDDADAAIGKLDGPHWVVDRSPVDNFEIHKNGDNRLEVNIKEDGSQNDFYHYQGMKYLADGDTGSSSWGAGDGSTLSYDFYIDPNWVGDKDTDENAIAQRTGIWGVMENDDGDITAYPCFEYVDADAGKGGDESKQAEAGFRAFFAQSADDTVGSWQWIGIPEGIDPDGDGWVTVQLTFEEGVGYHWSIDGVEGFTDPGPTWDGSTGLKTFILNSSNTGDDTSYLYDNIVLTDGEGEKSNTLVVDADSEYATIQSAIDAAEDGDTILVQKGTYTENVVINKDITLAGAEDGVVIEGTFHEDNDIAPDDSLEEFFAETKSYAGTSGAGITVQASGATIQNVEIHDFYTGIELANGASDLLIQDVDISAVGNGIRKGTEATIDNVDIVGGSISDGHIGIYFAKTTDPTKTDIGTATDVTIDQVDFSHLSEKGIYVEALSDSAITNITMDHVGVLGRGPAFDGNPSHLGGFGTGIDINLKNGTYSDIKISDFKFTDVGTSEGTSGTDYHEFGAAISIKARDDGSYGPAPARYEGEVVIENGSIDGTSTGIRAGEPGKEIGGPALKVTNVEITDFANDGVHGTIDNVTQETLLMRGTAGADVIVAAPTTKGQVSIDGGAGADTLGGGAEEDTLSGGAGGDVFFGSRITLDGDIITDFGAGDLLVLDGASSGTKVTYNGDELVIVDGADTVTIDVQDNLPGAFRTNTDGEIYYVAPTGGGGDGGDIGGGTTGGEEDDTLAGTDDADTMSGGGGNDEIEGGGGNDTLFSGEGNDTVDGGDGDDMVFGGAGDDVVTGGGGNDQAYGGTGNDDIDGGDGDDFLGGGEGNDTIIGGGGNDVLFGGKPGLGADANDAFYAGDGDDQGYAGDGDDIATGGAGADTVGGGGGNDTVGGGDGNDLLYGGAGDDMLYGGADADTIYGGSGNDQIYFGDNDGAADLYASVADNGADVVFGFENGTDHLDVRANGFTSFAELTIGEDGEGNATIDLGGGHILTLNGVAASELDAADFVF